MIYATAYDHYSTPVRLKLNPDTAIEIGNPYWAAGLNMLRCWFGKKRIVTEAYSIWDDGHGRCCGMQYDVLTDVCDILRFCDKANIEPPSFIKEEEA